MLQDFRDRVHSFLKQELKDQGWNPYRVAKAMDKQGLMKFQTVTAFFNKKAGSVETIEAIALFMGVLIEPRLTTWGIGQTRDMIPVMKKCQSCNRNFRWGNIEDGECSGCRSKSC